MTDTIQRVLDDGTTDYLRDIESGLYDRGERLLEEKLQALDALPLPPCLRDRLDMRSYQGLTFLGALPGAARAAIAALGGSISPCDLSRGVVVVRQAE